MSERTENMLLAGMLMATVAWSSLLFYLFIKLLVKFVGWLDASGGSC